MKLGLLSTPLLLAASATGVRAQTQPAWAVWQPNPVIKADGQWRGNLSGGLSLSSGNTQTTTLNLGFDALRATPDSKLRFYGTGLYGNQRTNGSSNTIANLVRTGGRYDLDYGSRLFSFTGLDFEHDKLQKLDLRSVLGLGLGRHLIKSSETAFDFFGGLTYMHERFTDFHRDSAELLFGEETTQKLSESSTVRERLSVFPNLKEGGEYRIQFDASVDTAITSTIGLRLTLSDRYLSNSPAGVKRNDLLFLTNITYRIGPR